MNLSYDRLRVYVRIKPLSSSSSNSIVLPQSCRNGINISCKNNNDDSSFIFDEVFNDQSSQDQIYNIIGKSLLTKILSGYSCALIAYGQTGSGKTHSMIGKDNLNDGMIPKILNELFLSRIESSKTQIMIECIELYKEQIIDLLKEDTESKKLVPRILSSGIIINTTKVECDTLPFALSLFEKASSKRRTCCTVMNERSSRSHFIMIVNVETSESLSSGELVRKFGKIYFADLAGSESLESVEENDVLIRQHLESKEINRSLLCLGRVMYGVVHNSFVPYRDSKLTQILADAFKGEAITIMLVTISQDDKNYTSSLSTLRYATRAKNIKINAKSHIEREGTFEQQQKLQNDVINLRDKLIEMENAHVVDMENMTESRRILEELQDQLDKYQILDKNEEHITNEKLLSIEKISSTAYERANDATTATALIESLEDDNRKEIECLKKNIDFLSQRVAEMIAVCGHQVSTTLNSTEITIPSMKEQDVKKIIEESLKTFYEIFQLLIEHSSIPRGERKQLLASLHKKF